MLMRPTLAKLCPAALLLAFAAGPALAQEPTIIQTENVRYDYAQVLRVTPVYQTLTATRMERRCDSAKAKDDSKLGRVVGAVKEAFAHSTGEDCRNVPVEREFRRPIAYDVDYVYKGARYRSRLAEDPGNRLKIRIGVTPAVAGARTR